MSDPTDLETRLADGLHGVADTAPTAGDLAGGARARLRRRRRQSAATVAAALAVVAIPVGLTVAGGGDDPAPDRREPTQTERIPDGWRVESFRDLTMRVPGDWAYGGGTDWCVNGRDLDSRPPQVSRPGVVPAIGCTPTYGYGVHFEDFRAGEMSPGTEGTVQQYSGSRYPDGAWLGYIGTGQAGVWVVTDERALTRRVLDTAASIAYQDPNGCPTSIQTKALSTREKVSVCRYSGGGWLEQSERLSRAETAELRSALESAPAFEATDPGKDCRVGSVDERVLLLLDGREVPVGIYPKCAEANGVTYRGERLQLTEEIMYWALSPGWTGAVGPGVPLPDRLRTE